MRFLLGRVSKVPPMTVEWNRLCGPFFGDQIATLTLEGRSAGSGSRRPARTRTEDGDLTTVAELTLS